MKINIDRIETNQLLQNALDKGIIDISDVQEKLIMKRIDEIIEKHKYKIWQGDNGFWYTYLPDDSKQNGRKLVKKKTEKKLYEALLKFYDETDKKDYITFYDCFLSYKELKSEVVSENTLDKYDSDYKRFFKGTWLEDCDIKKIMGDKLETFIIKRIKDLSLNQKAAKAMIGHIKNVFTHAIINEKIVKNPCIFLKSNTNYFRYCSTKLVNVEDRIANSQEISTVMEQINKDHIQKPNYIPSYAVEFAMLTGMRVGEIAALTWDSVKEDVIIVDKEDIYERKRKIYHVVNYTKNRKPRLIPITSDLRNLLNRVENIEKMFGYYGKYIFMNEKGRINKRTISDCARNKSYQSGLEKSKSIHCYRRTVNSTIKCNGASDVVASSLLGNTVEVNNQYYTYDTTDIEQKRVILENANKMMLSDTKK